jgi:very-short-patch-repair endonuclease
MDPNAVDRRLKSQRLKRVHTGVYLVGPVMPPRAREMAAVLACGERSVLSHRSAAALWKLLPYPANSLVDVTVPIVDRGRSRRGIRVHRVQRLETDETTRCDGIPTTTPARTILDLAADVGARELERAVAQAERRHLASEAKLHALLARYPRRPGSAALRRLLQRSQRPAFTRSEAEERLLSLIRRAGLPSPEVNVQLEDIEVDFLWREQGLVVEVDGFRYHSSQADFERDRRRDAELLARGLRVLRVSAAQILHEPEATVVRIGQALVSRDGG